MKRFLERLAVAVHRARTNGNIQPELDVNETQDLVIGLMPMFLRRLYVTRREIINALDALAEQLRAQENELTAAGKFTPEVAKGMMVEHAIARSKVEDVDALFWGAVKRHFPELLLTDVPVGIRKGWKVVVKRPEPQLEVVEMITGDRMFLGHPDGKQVFFEKLLASLAGVVRSETGSPSQEVASTCDVCPEQGRCEHEAKIRAAGL